MQFNTFKTLLLGFFLTLSFIGHAFEKEAAVEENFDTKELIFHHIGSILMGIADPWKC